MVANKSSLKTRGCRAYNMLTGGTLREGWQHFELQHVHDPPGKQRGRGTRIQVDVGERERSQESRNQH